MARLLERFPNLVTMFFARAAEKGDAPFLWTKASGTWVATSWAEAARRVASLATALTAIGLKRGDRVMLVSENRPEWCLSDLAIMAAGCITVPTYVTNTERDHLHIIENAGACAIIVSTAKLAKTVLPAVIRSNQAQTVIGLEDMKVPAGIDFHNWHALIAAHQTAPETAAARADFAREDLACIIYTSGTGGAPRGVMQRGDAPDDHVRRPPPVRSPPHAHFEDDRETGRRLGVPAAPSARHRRQALHQSPPTDRPPDAGRRRHALQT
jgi:long-chain acyl-CoA synthetase